MVLAQRIVVAGAEQAAERPHVLVAHPGLVGGVALRRQHAVGTAHVDHVLRVLGETVDRRKQILIEAGPPGLDHPAEKGMGHVEVPHVLSPSAIAGEAAAARQVSVAARLLVHRRDHVFVQQCLRLRQIELRAGIVDPLAREHETRKRQRAQVVVQLVGVVRHLIRPRDVVRGVVEEVVHHRDDHVAQFGPLRRRDVVPQVVEGERVRHDLIGQIPMRNLAGGVGREPPGRQDLVSIRRAARDRVEQRQAFELEAGDLVVGVARGRAVHPGSQLVVIGRDGRLRHARAQRRQSRWPEIDSRMPCDHLWRLRLRGRHRQRPEQAGRQHDGEGRPAETCREQSHVSMGPGRGETPGCQTHASRANRLLRRRDRLSTLFCNLEHENWSGLP